MTISDANDVQTVLRYVLAEPNAAGLIPDADAAGEAAQRLAARSQKALGAGMSAEQVAAVWPSLEINDVRSTS